MKKQIVITILIGCFIIFGADSALGKSNKPELLKGLYAAAVKGNSYVSKGITLDSHLKDVREKFGEPKDKQNDEWDALFVYDSFSILFAEYLPALKDTSEILEIRIYIGNDDITYKDIVKALGKPIHEDHNDAEQRWQVFYKAGDNCLGFYSVSKENPMVEAVILKPSAELKKHFRNRK